MSSTGRRLVSVRYTLHESRGKTRTSRCCIDLDRRTVKVLESWRGTRIAEDHAGAADPDAYVFARPDGAPVHPQVLSDTLPKLVRRSGLRRAA